jgi:hypothetical protein
MSDQAYRGGPYPPRASGSSMILLVIPLTLIPILAYTLLGMAGWVTDWTSPIVTVATPSGGQLGIGMGDLIVLLALVRLFLEVLKSTRTSTGSIVDHMVSTLVFVGALVMLLLVPFAGTATFLILTGITLFDVVAGFSVTIRSARRDIGLGPTS